MTDISRRHLIQTAAGIAAVAGAAPAMVPQAMAQGAMRGGAIRARFALDPALLYVNAANLCPTFQTAIAAEKAESAALQANPSQEYRRRYNDMIVTIHTRIGKNINAPADSIALTRNCSEASGNVTRGVRLKAGDEVIIGHENHPSNTNWWKRREQTEGIVVKVATPADEPKNMQEVLDSYISLAGPRTKVLALSHQTNLGGIIAPVNEIGRFCRSKNIWFHVDAAQTFGWKKIDVAAIGCDSMAASTHKWMMGPIGGGVLYVRPEKIAELDPLMLSVDYYHTGPNNALNAQAFEYLGQRPDAMLPGLLAALDERDALGGEEGIEKIARANAAMMRQKLSSKGIKVLGSGDPALWGTVLAADIKGLPDSAKMLYGEKKLAGSITHVSGKALLRISPHVYNTAEELDQVANLVTMA
jgi:selenocysteine lyase/cysteine desulfurase